MKSERLFHVFAALILSEWAIVIVASMSIVNPADRSGPAPAAQAQASAPARSEEARLTAFLDKEFAQEVALKPQLATGAKVFYNGLDGSVR